MQVVLRISSDPVEVIRDRMKMTKHIEIIGVKKENMETAFRTLMRTVRQTVDSSIARQCRLFSYRLPEAAVIVQRRIRLSTNVAAHSTRKKYCITQSPHMRLMVYFTFVSICRLIGKCSELRRITSHPLIWRI